MAHRTAWGAYQLLAFPGYQVKLDPDNVDISYLLSHQSGPKSDFRPNITLMTQVFESDLVK
jgi:hypothetical protein